MIFFDDVFNNEEQFAFQSPTEQALKTLHIPKYTDSLFFEKVLNTNRLEDIQGYSTQFRLLLSKRGEDGLGTNPEGLAAIEALNARLLKADYFLTIKVQKVEKRLIYTIRCYRTFKNKHEKTFLYIDVLNPMCEKQVYIDANEIEREEKKFIQTLLQCFPEANYPPNAQISVENQFIKKNETILIGQGDTITIDGSNSFDSNNSPADLTYQWKQLNTYRMNRSDLIALAPSKMKQQVIFNKKGSYKIGLIVSDGVANSIERVMTINVVERPQITLLTDTLYRVKKQGNMFSYGYKFNEILELGQQRLTQLDTPFFTIKYYKYYENETFILQKKPRSMKKKLTSDRLRIQSNKALRPGYYQVEVRTKNKFLTSNPQTFSIDYRMDFLGGINVSYDIHSFDYVKDTINQFIWGQGVSATMTMYVYQNFGFEMGFTDIFKARTNNQSVAIEGFGSYFNYYALTYKLPPMPIAKSYLEASLFVGRRQILNVYDPITNTLSYRYQTGFGGTIHIQPSYKIPLFIITKIGVYPNPYADEEKTFLDRGYSVISFGLRYMVHL